MGKMQLPLAQQLANKLTTQPDSRIRNLVTDGEPGSQIMGELLTQYLRSTKNLAFQYLSQGRSGAKVLILVHSDRQARVIKFAPSEKIQKEVDNYRSTSVKEKINSRYRPKLLCGRKVVAGYCSLAYEYAGGGNARTTTFRDAFGALEGATLSGCIQDLFYHLIQWREVTRGNQPPFDQWTWDPGTREAAQNILRNHRNSVGSEIDPLFKVLEGEVGHWRDLLRAKCSSSATCHGDMNCDNIVIVTTRTGAFPVIIDFGNVKRGWSPACDSAKLERDIKIRCLRNTMQHPENYRQMLRRLGSALASGSHPTGTTQEFDKAFKLIKTIRSDCSSLLYAFSDIPMVEYAYFLLCWTLSYFGSDEYKKEHGTWHQEYTAAVVDAACQAYREVENAVRSAPGEIPSFESIPLPQERTLQDPVNEG